MHPRTYVRRYRKHWSLSQDELARFLGVSQSVASRIENGEGPPDFNVALALQVVFGRPPRALFTHLYRKVEEEVMRVAAEMDRELAGKTDRYSVRRQELLESMSARAGTSTDPL
jgi:transcriptional regulator with XRE-family HTH domain